MNWIILLFAGLFDRFVLNLFCVRAKRRDCLQGLYF